MTKSIRTIRLLLLVLLLPSLAFSANLSGLSCLDCTTHQVELPDCCAGMDDHAIGDSSGQAIPVEKSDCAGSGLCLEQEGEVGAVTLPLQSDTVVLASPVLPEAFNVSNHQTSLQSDFSIPDSSAPLYILHCAFLI